MVVETGVEAALLSRSPSNSEREEREATTRERRKEKKKWKLIQENYYKKTMHTTNYTKKIKK